MPDRDFVAPAAVKLREVLRDRIVELDLSALDEQPDRGGRRGYLRQRRRVEDRVLGHRLFMGNESAMAVGVAVDLVAALDPDHAARELSGGDLRVDLGVDARVLGSSSGSGSG